MNAELETLYKMGIGDQKTLPLSQMSVLRVPGGWIYFSAAGSTFVPYVVVEES